MAGLTPDASWVVPIVILILAVVGAWMLYDTVRRMERQERRTRSRDRSRAPPTGDSDE